MNTLRARWTILLSNKRRRLGRPHALRAQFHHLRIYVQSLSAHSSQTSTIISLEAKGNNGLNQALIAKIALRFWNRVRRFVAEHLRRTIRSNIRRTYHSKGQFVALVSGKFAPKLRSSTKVGVIYLLGRGRQSVQSS